MTRQIVPPDYLSKSFNCPHCQAFSAMHWGELLLESRARTFLESAQCHVCLKRSIWATKTLEVLDSNMNFVIEGEMIWPIEAAIVPAHPMMPDLIKQDFEEARQIAALSPRAAAALLRLCIEKLCRHLTGTKDDINFQIAALVKQGLSAKIQKALDSVRVIGNEAVHPGTLDIDDSEKYVYPLFKLVNLIIEELIATPAEIDDIFNSLPQGKRDGITQRDAQKPAGKP